MILKSWNKWGKMETKNKMILTRKWKTCLKKTKSKHVLSAASFSVLPVANGLSPPKSAILFVIFSMSLFEIGSCKYLDRLLLLPVQWLSFSLLLFIYSFSWKMLIFKINLLLSFYIWQPSFFLTFFYLNLPLSLFISDWLIK